MKYGCLCEVCPNHCCSSKFLGLSEALINHGSSEFAKIKLDEFEVRRIQEFGRSDLIIEDGDNYFLKLNDDNSCLAFENGKCLIYEVRPDVCKLYPYYFDPFCGICIDKNCPGSFELDLEKKDLEMIYELLNNRLKLFYSSAINDKDINHPKKVLKK